MKVKGESKIKVLSWEAIQNTTSMKYDFGSMSIKNYALMELILVMSSNGKSKKNKGLKALLNKEI